MEQRIPEGGETKLGETRGTINGVVKLGMLLLLPMGMMMVGVLVTSKYLSERIYVKQEGVLVSAQMNMVNWEGFGMVFEPIITLPVKTKIGFEDHGFLIDSGALVSSLPREWAEKTGQDLAFLPRSTFVGFGGATSLAYQGMMVVKMGDRHRKIPIVFTEVAGTKSLLGRKGFFEDYSIYFNHKAKQIEIRE